jgi:hypothetical protein
MPYSPAPPRLRRVPGGTASLHDLIAGDDIDVASLAAHLDGLGSDERVRQVRSLAKAEQARLFDAAAGVRPIGLDDVVDPALEPLHEVVHAGRNSLPVLKTFEKRFCRPPENADVLWGYNEHGARWMTGPGYFVARGGEPGEVLIDYQQVPPAKPESWPAIKPNSAFRGRFVYGGTQDVLRGVSAHVAAGRAFKRGAPMDNWFVLCRVDASA